MLSSKSGAGKNFDWPPSPVTNICVSRTSPQAEHSNGREAVRAPAIASDAMVNNEKTIGVVAALDRLQTRRVATPACLLPVRQEIIAFGHVTACPRRS